MEEEQPVKNCRTCAHVVRASNPRHDCCLLCGHYCITQRKYPSSPCDENLSGWTPRPPSLLQRILGRLFP